MKKIIASDYDRTFYLNDNDIKKNLKQVEEFRKNGNIFIIATGRSYYHFMKVVKKFNIIIDYAIINHGATVIDSNDNVIVNYPINNDIIKDLKKDLNLEESVEYFCCSELETKVPFEHKDLTKIHVNYKTKKESLEMNEYINSRYNKYIDSYNITSSSIEIISNQTNKSKMIKLLSERLNIEMNNIYTIGDGYTDIKMIKDFNGYCMKNSVPELKSVSKGEYNSVSDLIEKVLKNSMA